MKKTKIVMGMPATVEIIDKAATGDVFDEVFDYFHEVDAKYSTYKLSSEISKVNQGLPKNKWSAEMKQVLDLCEQTKQQTDGYFEISHAGKLDPSGLVKGWAIHNAAQLLAKRFRNFYVEIAGDVEIHGSSAEGQLWRIGIRNPFKREEIVKIIELTDKGVATSGTYIRGQHIYDPKNSSADLEAVASLTVIGPNIYEADRFATAAFAMGKRGIEFIEKLDGFEGYMISGDKLATLTSGFERYVVAG